MKFLSVCSGIEAASVAWNPLGWEAVAFAEIEPFPCSLLAHHYPDTPNWGDMTKFKEWPDVPIDLLCGGTPCQSFSVAGLRAGLADPRGNLALTYLAIAAKYRPKWLVWENVPGVFSSLSHDAPDPCAPPPPVDMECDGQELETADEYTSEELHAFNCFLAGLSELGYGWAYRVLDAQYFGVPQRRRRPFVVGCLGDRRSAAAVLFERHSLSGNPAPSRKAGEGFAASTAPSLTASGRGVERTGETRGQDPVIAVHVAPTLSATYGEQCGQDYMNGLMVAHAFDARQADVLQYGPVSGPMDTGFPGPTICFSAKDHGADAMRECSPTLRAGGHSDSHANAGVMPAIAYPLQEVGKRTGVSTTDPRAGLGIGKQGDPMFTLQAGAQHGVAAAMQVRRLTPRECERLQGFADDYTLVPHNGKPAADGPRYKAIGNSWAVPCAMWIGERINKVEALA